MTKLTLGTHPFLLGFEQLERLVERTAKASGDGYPPYNIEQTSDRSYRITLAVAGFAEADLSITVEDSQLVVRGRQSDAGSERVFLHRGIAARQFQRSFVLADGVEVGGAVMENGLLHIDLSRQPADSVVQRHLDTPQKVDIELWQNGFVPPVDFPSPGRMCFAAHAARSDHVYSGAYNMKAAINIDIDSTFHSQIKYFIYCEYYLWY